MFEPLLVVAATFAAAEISYRVIELPALRLKRHFVTTTLVAPSEPIVPEERVLIAR